MNILIVDDHPTNLDLLDAILRAEGHRPIRAQSGPEAVERAMAGACDLVLMDLVMPGAFDGLEAMRRLRAAGFARGIVCHSAHVLAAVQEQALLAGADGFLAKPFRRQDVLSAIAHLPRPSLVA